MQKLSDFTPKNLESFSVLSAPLHRPENIICKELYNVKNFVISPNSCSYFHFPLARMFHHADRHPCPQIFFSRARIYGFNAEELC